MESKFRKSEVSCLQEVLREIRNAELTQELRLSDGMPDVGRILGAWGQVVMRGTQWQRDNVQLSAGMQVHILYQPEGGGRPECLEGWIPFQMNWDIPDDTPQGHIRICCRNRVVDARSTSARKILVRAGAAAMAEILAPATYASYMPENVPEDVQLLQNTYPMCLPREAGEKSFQMEEELTLPASAPIPEKVIYYSFTPEIVDRKVLSDKLVFRGTGKLHVLYESAEGQLHGWDFEIPFSQYGQLERIHSSEARAEILPGVTSLELERDEEGHLHLKSGLIAQYLICDMEMLALTEDAYSPLRELGVRQEQLELPAVLDSRQENVYGEQTLTASGNMTADVQFLRDFPRLRQTGDAMELELPGLLQVLYYDDTGNLQTIQQRTENRHTLKSAPENRIVALPLPGGEPQVYFAGDKITVKTEQPLQILARAGKGIPMVTALELGEVRERDPDRPSLILRRAGRDRLWDIARQTGSTVEQIMLANGLQEEPEADRMLLIPVS